MYIVKRTPEFLAWLKSLKDPVTRQRLTRRLEKAEQGHLGDVKPVGSSVFEMREFFGPGWRMYTLHRHNLIFVKKLKIEF
jgi:putative addiction module killer protein